MNRYKHNKFAQFLFDYCLKGAKILNKYPALYYILLFTWGIFMTLIGLFTSLFLLILKKKPLKYKRIFYFKIKPRWGGISLGITFVRDTTSSELINPHEYGHTFQNALLGPLFIFIIAIPSVIRYWYQTTTDKTINAYDAIRFEDSATIIGRNL